MTADVEWVYRLPNGHSKHARKDCPALHSSPDVLAVWPSAAESLRPCARCTDESWYAEWHEWMDTHDPIWMEIARVEASRLDAVGTPSVRERDVPDQKSESPSA